MKECSFCGWEVPENAVKCKHCGEFISEKYKKTQQVLKRGIFQCTARIFCPECHYEGRTTKMERRGSGYLWCFLLLCGVIPWIFYNLWRGSYYFICPNCGNKHVKAVDRKGD